MTAQETLGEIRSKLLNREIVFGNLDRYDIDYAEGQKAIIYDVRLEYVGEREFIFEVLTDFSKFEDHNKALNLPDYYDRAGKPSLYFHETDFYPKDGKIEFYIGEKESEWPFKVIGNSDATSPVVLSAESWNKIVAHVGKKILDELEVKPL